MPEISRFLGIVIVMHYSDHPPPHFHAKYGEYEATVNILYGTVEGRFPRRVRRLVLEWYEIHYEELLENWALAQQRIPLRKIEPLR